MNKIFLSCTLVAFSLISNRTYGQDQNKTSSRIEAIKIVQKTMPNKVTIDGKRIYNVTSDHICSITVTMESSKKYQFSLITWPEKGQVDDTGYTAFFLKDTDSKPHILRTDHVKGKSFLINMNKLVQNCQEFSKTNKITAS